MEYKYNDGGRSQYFKAKNVDDCVVRAIAIAKGLDYKEVYDKVWKIVGYSPRNGIKHKDVRSVMELYGFKWTSCMGIGTGCRVHMKEGELPKHKTIVVSLSGHISVVVDGVINDTYDPSRGGTRCVYGYWTIL